MKKTLFAIILALAASTASAQDYRTSGTSLVSGVTGYISHAESPARVTTSASTARTATAVPAYSYVRLVCSQDTNVHFGDVSINATAADPRLVGNTPEVFNMGPSTYVAFIAGGAGTCDVTVLR